MNLRALVMCLVFATLPLGLHAGTHAAIDCRQAYLLGAEHDLKAQRYAYAVGVAVALSGPAVSYGARLPFLESALATFSGAYIAVFPAIVGDALKDIAAFHRAMAGAILEASQDEPGRYSWAFARALNAHIHNGRDKAGDHGFRLIARLRKSPDLDQQLFFKAASPSEVHRILRTLAIDDKLCTPEGKPLAVAQVAALVLAAMASEPTDIAPR